MSAIERHTKTEVGKRAEECYRLRYESTPSITQEKWVEYCHEVYGDRSEQTYCSYWAKAKEMYDNSWKERLNQMLGPASDRIRELLNSDNPSDQKEAIKMIFKYTGNDVERQEIKATVETIKVGFAVDGD